MLRRCCFKFEFTEFGINFSNSEICFDYFRRKWKLLLSDQFVSKIHECQTKLAGKELIIKKLQAYQCSESFHPNSKFEQMIFHIRGDHKRLLLRVLNSLKWHIIYILNYFYLNSWFLFLYFSSVYRPRAWFVSIFALIRDVCRHGAHFKCLSFIIKIVTKIKTKLRSSARFAEHFLYSRCCAPMPTMITIMMLMW